MKDLMKRWKLANEVIACITTVIIISILPLVFHDYYFDILDTKYYFYCSTVICMAAVMLLLTLIVLWLNKGTIVITPKLRKSDWAMISFLFSVVLSCVLSDYRFEAFWGTEGRFMGTFLYLILGISFFTLGHCLKFKRWYLEAFLVTGMVVCSIGIMQYFLLDPFGLKKDIHASHYTSFISTVGNINTYASYVALIFGMSTTLFVRERNTARKSWYVFTVILSLFALVTGNSDNAYLTIGVIVLFLPLYAFRDMYGLKQYMLLISMISTEFMAIGAIDRRYASHVLPIGGLFRLIVVGGGGWLIFVVAALWGCTAFICILERVVQKKYKDVCEICICRRTWGTVLILVIAVLIYMTFDATRMGNGQQYGILKDYLLINDEWGTHRGYIWRIGIECYMKYSPLRKMFGSGPDTFGIVTQSYYREMIERYYEIFDSAHNEYLQYLITIGIVGLFSYLFLLVSSIIEIIKASKREASVMSIVYAVSCYAAQAVVNIGVPIVFPVMFTLLVVGISAQNGMDKISE